MNENLILVSMVGIPLSIVIFTCVSIYFTTIKSDLINIVTLFVSVSFPVVAFILVFRDGVIADETGSVGNIFGNLLAFGLIIVSVIASMLNIFRNFKK